MTGNSGGNACAVVLFTASFLTVSLVTASLVTVGWAAEPEHNPATEELTEFIGAQHLLELPVRVVDEQGNPVVHTKITPWALGCSQGHGTWRAGDEDSGVDPRSVTTDEKGVAAVKYPRYRDADEQVRTLAVSLHVDHPYHAFVGDLHVDVPLETEGPYEIKLPKGAIVELRPLVDGKPADLENLFAFWSDGRSRVPEVAPEKLADGALRLPAMSPGKNGAMLVKLDGDRPTHFSRILDLDLTAGEVKRIDAPLQPAARIEGTLSDNVPRPVRNGRIGARTLPQLTSGDKRIPWYTLAPVRPDGTFTIEGWPADQPLQLIALCDQYIAASGAAPDAVENPPDPAKDSFQRPQMFAPDDKIVVAMEPLVPCEVSAVDEADKPVAGVRVISWPNVGWWNIGSQIYGHNLARGEDVLRKRNYMDAIDEDAPYPFEGTTDAQGKTVLYLPAGSEDLAVDSDDFELPVFLGRREQDVELIPGQTSHATLRLQPRGTDTLGEWDKLAGVVFGCSTREGRRICALPGIRAKMDEFAQKFRDAENQRDPKLLAEAYTAVAVAFADAGDPVEAAKWRQKSADEAAKVEAAGPATTN